MAPPTAALWSGHRHSPALHSLPFSSLVLSTLVTAVLFASVQVLDARAGDDWIVSDLKDQLFYRRGFKQRLPPALLWEGAFR